MTSFYVGDYTPQPGQLCRTFKGKDSVYPVSKDLNCLISQPLEPGEIILITKAVYQEELSSFYVEFMRDNRLFYSYFYEQVVCFIENGDGEEIIKLEAEDRPVTFDYPWVLCE